jgi:hypothetical protein
VDEERIDSACNAPVVLNGGDHRLRAAERGFKELMMNLEVPSGGARTVTIALEAEKKEGRLSVTAKPGGIISIDGSGAGKDTWSGVLAAGKHSLVVSAPERKEYRAEIDLGDKDERNMVVTLEEDSSGVPVWIFIAGGAVLAAGAATAGYLLLRPGNAEPVGGTLGTHVLQ